MNGSVTVNSGGTVAPGLSPGIINTGNFNLNSGSMLTIELDGHQGAGVDPNGHDQVNVNGTVTGEASDGEVEDYAVTIIDGTAPISISVDLPTAGGNFETL